MEPRNDSSPIHEIQRADGVLKKIRIQLDQFKKQWKDRGIRRRFHLTISGCLGPCPLANVVLIQFRGQSVWLHSINNEDDVRLIYDYVEQMLHANSYLPPPLGLVERHFQRYEVDTIEQSSCAVRS
jgi:cobaltochelatase CobN